MLNGKKVITRYSSINAFCVLDTPGAPNVGVFVVLADGGVFDVLGAILGF